jgi:hypothetical protein
LERGHACWRWSGDRETERGRAVFCQISVVDAGVRAVVERGTWTSRILSNFDFDSWCLCMVGSCRLFVVPGMNCWSIHLWERRNDLERRKENSRDMSIVV